MKTYYRFIFSNDTIIEYDTEMVSFKYAQRKACEWAKDFNATFEYCGVFEHEEF